MPPNVKNFMTCRALCPDLVDAIDSSLQLSSYDERKKLWRGARSHQGKPLLTGRLLNLFGNQLEHRFQVRPAMNAEY